MRSLLLVVALLCAAALVGNDIAWVGRGSSRIVGPAEEYATPFTSSDGRVEKDEHRETGR